MANAVLLGLSRVGACLHILRYDWSLGGFPMSDAAEALKLDTTKVRGGTGTRRHQG